MRTKLTHDQHVVLATKICASCVTLEEAFFEIQAAFGKSHPSAQFIRRALKTLSAARASLDIEYSPPPDSAGYAATFRNRS